MESRNGAMFSDGTLRFSDINKTGKRVYDENTTAILSGLAGILKSRGRDDTITLADYGTVDGGNILPLLTKIIDYIEDIKGPNQKILIYFDEQCTNDFNALVKTVMGDHNGLSNYDNVRVFMSATSMYKQCLPSASLDFGFSVYAANWLSESPMENTEEIITDNKNSLQYSLYHAQAKKDWRNFVMNRGKELKSGGLFFLSCLRTGDIGKLKHVDDIYKQMVEDGITTSDEYLNTKINVFVHRTIEDFTSIFNNNDEGITTGLELVSCHPRHREYWPFDQSLSMSETYLSNRANGLCILIKSWMYFSIRGGLSTSRSEEEKTTITDIFFDRLRNLIAFEGSKFQYIHPMVDIIFKKK